MIYNFTVAIARIHFAICEVRSNNSNPGIFFINFANILMPIYYLTWDTFLKGTGEAKFFFFFHKHSQGNRGKGRLSL